MTNLLSIKFRSSFGFTGIIIMFCLVFAVSATVFAQEAENTDIQADSAGAQKDIELKKITVHGEKIEVPGSETIDVDSLQIPGSPQNIMDLLKNQAILDYQGKSSLLPDDDTFYMRGFSANRFVTAIDGLALIKTGGRKSSHIVDFALLPAWMIESVEIIPGPHSPFYPGKTIGGVVNLKTRRLKKYVTLVPSGEISAGYGSYNTQNYDAVLNGGVKCFNYDIGYQRYSSDGYLRNSEAVIDTLYGRIGYLFSNDSLVAFSSSVSRADRQIPVNNNNSPTIFGSKPAIADPNAGYDDDYPEISTSEFNDWQNPTWDKVADSYRVYADVPDLFGDWIATGYFSRENRDRSYDEYKNYNDPSEGTRDGSWNTKWQQMGARIEDSIVISRNNKTTLAVDTEQLYDGYGYCATWTDANDMKHRVGITGAAAEHLWKIAGSLTLQAGLRYEDVKIWVSNFSTSNGYLYIAGEDKWIERHWNGLMPKSFLTWNMDAVSDWLRRVSLSAGLSRIWHAPDYHGIYNPQGRPAGAWLDPEHGIAADAVFKKRILKDTLFQVQYSYYIIKDYFCYNSSYAEYPAGPSPEGKEDACRDYVINLDEVRRQGVEFNLRGNVTSGLNAYISYAFQHFESRGGEPCGETGLNDVPVHKFNAGLRYNLQRTGTGFIIDYSFESEKVETYTEDSTGDFVYYENKIGAYQLVDIAVEQQILKDHFGLKRTSVKLYVNNLFDEKYEDARGYPMAGRTFGGSVNMKF